MVWIASACREWSNTYQVGSEKLCPFDCCLSDLEGLVKAFLVLICGKAVITDKKVLDPLVSIRLRSVKCSLRLDLFWD